MNEIPEPAAMVAHLDRLHFKVGLWQRANVVEGDYALYREAEARGYLVTGPDGRPFVCRQKYGGPSALVDFTSTEATRWWQEKVEALVALGVRVFMLNSASSGFIEAYPEARDLRFQNGLTGAELEHYYGPLYAKAVWEALRRALGGRRAVLHVFHQTYFAGGRFPYMGLGDRDWQGPRSFHIRCALNYALTGVPFWEGGAIGSFRLPGVGDALNTRLIPYTYTHWRLAHDTGQPVVRPLVLDWPDDPRAYEADTQFLFGREFLVAPPLEDAAAWRRVFLPPGEWIDYWTKERHIGGGWQQFRVGPKVPALLVRAGAIIPLGPTMEWVDQVPTDPLQLDIFPAGDSRFELYEDDGDTYAYETGASATTHFACRDLSDRIEIEIGPLDGDFDGKPSSRTYVLHVFGTTRPSEITVDGEPLKEREPVVHSGGRPRREVEGELIVERRSDDTADEVNAGWWYRMGNGFDRTVLVTLPSLSTGSGVRIVLLGSRPARYFRGDAGGAGRG